MAFRDPVQDDIPEEIRQRAERNGRAKLPETRSAAELLSLELPPVRWVVPDIAPEGLLLLAGKPKLGKSWFALGLAVAVAACGVALGTRPVERGEALYLGLEDNERRLQKRLRKILDGSDAPEGLHMATAWPRMDDGGAEALEGWMEAHSETRLVGVDVLKKVRPLARKHQSVYEADYEALEAMHAVAAKYGVSILVVHHTRKQAAADPLDEISGSLGLSGAADGVLILKRDRGRGDAYLYVDGRDFEESAELALTWDADTASWTLAGDADEYRLSKERAVVIGILRDAAELMSPKEIADSLGKTVGSVKVLLGEMVKDGQVVNPTYGKYGLPSQYTNSPYSANSDAESKSGKRSKGGGDGRPPFAAERAITHSTKCLCEECVPP